MKHTFWFIDKLMNELYTITRSGLQNEAQKEKAAIMIDAIKQHEKILKKLIDNHKVDKHLTTLIESHNESVSGWAESVEEHLKKLDHLLDVIEEFIRKLENSLHNQPEKWQEIQSDISHAMVLTGLHDEEETLKKLREVKVFDEEHLKEMIGDIVDIKKILR